MFDPRGDSAHYYDLNPGFPDDVPFYLAQLPSARARVLELGCGTGRVSVQIAEHCESYFGVDYSDAMVEQCRNRLAASSLSVARAAVAIADITDLHLARRFDLIIAPFRVLQNIESRTAVTGLFEGIRRHLSENGRCILNAFRPNRPPAELVELWSTPGEVERWELRSDDGRIVCLDRRTGVNPDPLTLYPNLVYRRYEGDRLVEESVLEIAMRCYYPDELLDLVVEHGFRVTRSWGGYHGETYGDGPELVVEFEARHR